MDLVISRVPLLIYVIYNITITLCKSYFIIIYSRSYTLYIALILTQVGETSIDDAGNKFVIAGVRFVPDAIYFFLLICQLENSSYKPKKDLISRK